VDKQLSASIITRVHSNPGLLQFYDKNCITPDSIFETPNEINCIWTDSIYPTLTKQIKKPTTPVREIESPLIQFLQLRTKQIVSGLIQFIAFTVVKIESGVIQFLPPRLNKLEIWQLR